MTTLKLTLIALVLLTGLYCDRIHKVQVYQDNATKKCLETHTAEQCKVLPYPACDENGCHK